MEVGRRFSVSLPSSSSYSYSYINILFTEQSILLTLSEENASLTEVSIQWKVGDEDRCTGFCSIQNLAGLLFFFHKLRPFSHHTCYKFQTIVQRKWGLKMGIFTLHRDVHGVVLDHFCRNRYNATMQHGPQYIHVVKINSNLRIFVFCKFVSLFLEFLWLLSKVVKIYQNLEVVYCCGSLSLALEPW